MYTIGVHPRIFHVVGCTVMTICPARIGRRFSPGLHPVNILLDNPLGRKQNYIQNGILVHMISTNKQRPGSGQYRSPPPPRGNSFAFRVHRARE